MTEKRASRKPKKLRPHALARRPLRGLVDLLSRPEKDGWPDHLLRACNVLADEITVCHGKTSDSELRELLIECVSAAHQCLKAQDLQLLNISRAEIRRQLQKGFKAAAACLKRQDRLHKKLDYDITNRLRTDQVVDLETLEFIFTATATILGKIPARRKSPALRAAIEERHFRDFAGLDPVAIVHCQKAITLLASKVSAGEVVTAVEVFTTLAKELRRIPASNRTDASHPFIIQFAKAIDRIWLQRGLRPSRAPNYLNPDYQTRFQEFLNLTYTAVVETPVVRRSGFFATPSNLVRLIGDHHLRKAITLKKMTTTRYGKSK